VDVSDVGVPEKPLDERFQDRAFNEIALDHSVLGAVAAQREQASPHQVRYGRGAIIGVARGHVDEDRSHVSVGNRTFKRRIGEEEHLLTDRSLFEADAAGPCPGLLGARGLNLDVAVIIRPVFADLIRDRLGYGYDSKTVHCQPPGQPCGSGRIASIDLART